MLLIKGMTLRVLSLHVEPFPWLDGVVSSMPNTLELQPLLWHSDMLMMSSLIELSCPVQGTAHVASLWFRILNSFWKRGVSFIHQFSPVMPTTTRVEPGWSWERAIQSGSPKWVVGTQLLEPSLPSPLLFWKEVGIRSLSWVSNPDIPVWVHHLSWQFNH